MTRTGRAMCAAHGLAFLWLAFCAVQQAWYGAAWAVALFTVASVTQLAAALRESDRADRRRITSAAEQLATGRPSASEADEAVLGLLHGCCDVWWTSTGAQHSAGCSGAGGWSP